MKFIKQGTFCIISIFLFRTAEDSVFPPVDDFLIYTERELDLQMQWSDIYYTSFPNGKG